MSGRPHGSGSSRLFPAFALQDHEVMGRGLALCFGESLTISTVASFVSEENLRRLAVGTSSGIVWLILQDLGILQG